MVIQYKAGQASVEFLILVGILMIIFAILFNYEGGNQFYSFELEIKNNLDNICNSVKNEIESAAEFGPVYNRTFYLPNGNYNITISGYTITVAENRYLVSCYIPVKNINGTLRTGKNILIYNESGIFIN